MNWKVFKRDDPSTYPELDCPLLICWTNGMRHCFYTAKWDNRYKQFVRDLRQCVFYEGDIFYKYLAYVPYIENELHPIKCGKEDKRCEYEDDGYCLYKLQCKHQKDSTEYSLGSKPIWKEY